MTNTALRVLAVGVVAMFVVAEARMMRRSNEPELRAVASIHPSGKRDGKREIIYKITVNGMECSATQADYEYVMKNMALPPDFKCDGMNQNTSYPKPPPNSSYPKPPPNSSYPINDGKPPPSCPKLGGSCILGAASPTHSSCRPEGPNAAQINYGNGFEFNILDEHNRLRHSAELNPKPAIPLSNLEWDDDLAFTATRHMSQCVFKHDEGHQRNTCRFPDVGQNLYYYWSSDGSGFETAYKEAILSWFSEIKDFKYGGGHTGDVGHFTQIVWEKTTHVGCGKVQCKDGSVYVACNYGPAGNVGGFDRPYSDNI